MRALAGDRHRRRILVSVVMSMVLVSSGGFLIFPLLPELQDRLSLSTAQIGYIAAAGFAAALVAEILVAPLADRGRARAMAVTGVVLVSASLLLSALAVTGWHLIAGRALGGFGFGIFVAAASALLVRAAPESSGELLGRLSAAELVGVAVGPLASGLAIGIFSPGPILAVSAAVVCLAVIPVALGFRERPGSVQPAGRRYAAGVLARDGTDALRIGRADAEAVSEASPPLPSLDLLRSPRILGIVLLYGAVMMPTGAYDGIWPRFMTDIGADPVLVALSYAVFAVPYVLVAGWAGRLADRRGGVSAFVRGLAILLPVVAAYGFIQNPWLATAVAFPESTGQALAFIGAAAAMAHGVDPARAGSAQGLLRGVGLIFAVIAATASGLLYEAGGALALFGSTAVAVLVVAALGVLLATRGAAAARGGAAERGTARP
jgi:MFS family permease